MNTGGDARAAHAAATDEGVIRRLFDLSVDLLGVLDLDATIVEVSPSFELTLGWPPSTLRGTSFLDLFHPDDLSRVESELARLREGGEVVAVVVRMRVLDGSYRWIQGNARSDLDAQRIFVSGADVTDFMSLEVALRRQLNLEELVAAIASRLIGAEPEHIVLEIERGLEDLAVAMGADRGHFLRGIDRAAPTIYLEWRDPTTSPRRHVPNPDLDVQRWWVGVLESERILRLDDVNELVDEAPHVVEALRDDGVRSILHVPLPPHRGHWGFITVSALRGAVSFDDEAIALVRLAGDCFLTALAASDDAEALLEARRELERQNQVLASSNSELERFAYSAAHDLKAPLGLVEMALAATPSSGGPADELVEVARRASARMRQLIEDLLTFATVGSAPGPPARVDLDDLLTEVLADLAAEVTAKGARIERSALPTVVGNRALLAQMLQNLVGNALKFARSDVQPVVHIAASPDGGGTVLTVSDNGIGIAAMLRERVFDVFTRLNGGEAYPGSGIGLATCAKVVEHHGGRIWIEDGLDGGVAVQVWLPEPGSAPGSLTHP